MHKTIRFVTRQNKQFRIQYFWLWATQQHKVETKQGDSNLFEKKKKKKTYATTYTCICHLMIRIIKKTVYVVYGHQNSTFGVRTKLFILQQQHSERWADICDVTSYTTLARNANFSTQYCITLIRMV